MNNIAVPSTAFYFFTFYLFTYLLFISRTYKNRVEKWNIWKTALKLDYRRFFPNICSVSMKDLYTWCSEKCGLNLNGEHRKHYDFHKHPN